MKIKVTQEDIDKGERDTSCSCPIALALKRTFNEKFEVTRTSLKFGLSNEDVNDADVRPCILLPPEARLFIVDYDGDYPVVPFEFELPID